VRTLRKKAEKENAMFKKLDSDNNGSISLAEFKASPRAQKDPTKAEQIFKKMDTDSNGGVSLEEFKSHRPDHAPKGAGRPGKGKKKGDAAPE
jgi:Ca2+-binding EF-hand superfamily protein